MKSSPHTCDPGQPCELRSGEEQRQSQHCKQYCLSKTGGWWPTLRSVETWASWEGGDTPHLPLSVKQCLLEPWEQALQMCDLKRQHLFSHKSGDLTIWAFQIVSLLLIVRWITSWGVIIWPFLGVCVCVCLYMRIEREWAFSPFSSHKVPSSIDYNWSLEFRLLIKFGKGVLFFSPQQLIGCYKKICKVCKRQCTGMYKFLGTGDTNYTLQFISNSVFTFTPRLPESRRLDSVKCAN